MRKKSKKLSPIVKSALRLEDVLDLTSFDGKIVELANKMYYSINRLQYSKRYKYQDFYLACLYLAYQEEGCPITMKEVLRISDYSPSKDKTNQMLVWKINGLAKTISRDKKLSVKTFTPHDYLISLCEGAGLMFDIPSEELKKDSEKILDKYISGGGEIKGRPSSYASAVVYMVTSKYFTREFTSREIEKVFGVNITTILKKKKDLEEIILN